MVAEGVGEIRINCLVLGKSGVGKSSLLNYLIGDKVAATGIGKPVTPREEGSSIGIFEYDPIDMGSYKWCVFDSWGIEADKAEDWLGLIHNRIDEADRKLKINSWFHCVVYCISAKGARLEEFEVESILRPLQKKGIGVVFALTKSDIASEQELSGLREEIFKSFGNDALICEVCSEQKILRGGRVREAYGADSLSVVMYESARRNLLRKYSASLLLNLDEMLDIWIKRVCSKFRSIEWVPNFIKMKKSIEFAKPRLKDLILEFQEAHQSSFEQMQQLYDEMFGFLISRSESNDLSKLKISDFDKKSELESTSDIFWSSLIFSSIPGLNLIYFHISNGVFEDVLEEKLEGVAEEVRRKIKVVVENDAYMMGIELKRKLTGIELQSS